MVNNQSYKWVRLIAPIYLILTISVSGQNISNKYSSSYQNNGMLYFIFPQNGFNNNKLGSKLDYDITYLTTKDTATLNFSYFEESNRKIDSFGFFNDVNNITSRVKKIYIETKKQKWHYRYSTQISFIDLNKFFTPTDNAKIILYTKEENITLSIKPSNWNKLASLTKKILTLISSNK
jgi:hypothetical protein